MKSEEVTIYLLRENLKIKNPILRFSNTQLYIIILIIIIIIIISFLRFNKMRLIYQKKLVHLFISPLDFTFGRQNVRNLMIN